jgi:hypothetical protein
VPSRRLATRLTLLPRGSAGAGALEYVGLLAAVAVIVAAVAVVPIAEPARAAVDRAVCLFLGGADCGAGQQAVALPKCETSGDSRKIGASVTAFSVKVGRDDTYSITRFGDGTARVSTGDVGSAGLAAGVGAGADVAFNDDGTLRGGGRAEVSATATAGLQLKYDFADAAEAQSWADANRNVFTQSLNFAGGPLADGAEQLWNAVDDGRPTPTAIAFQVGAAARFTAAGGWGGLAGGNAAGTASVTGTVEQNLKDGTSSFTTDAELGAEGQAVLAMAQGNAKGTWKSGYTVTYDNQGRPTGLQITQAQASQAAIGMSTKTLGLGGDGTVSSVGWDFDISEWGGETRTTAHLDLTVPANRAAFDEVFVLAGPAAVLRPDAMTSGGAESLARRLEADGLVTTALYAVDSGGGGIQLGGSAGVKFGVDVGADTQSRRLLDASYRTGRERSAGTRPLSTC